MTKTVTSHDVARLAGVSQATVSRALRNLPGTSPHTRDAVLTAAKELSYVPSDSGRALSTRNTRRIAMVAEDLTNPFYPELIEPIRRCLTATGLRTVLITDTTFSQPGVPGTSLNELSDASYDGVILTTTLRGSSLPRDLTERGVPHVLVNRVLDHPESHSCTVDNAAGAAQVATLLAGLGHEHIAAVHGPTATSTGRERAQFLRTSLRREGLTLPRAAMVRARFSPESGMAAAHVLLARTPRPTAIVCANDVMAFGVLSAARQLGISVPDELTVIGFDDIAMASWPLIDLTTVWCDREELAQVAVDLLLTEIACPGSTPVLWRVPVQLQLRSTHGPPRGAPGTD